jgi:uncharacterized protein
VAQQIPWEIIMRLGILAAIIAAIFAVNPVPAQSVPPAPSAESLAAAHELVQAAKVTDNFKLMLSAILLSLKSTVVQNRPELEKQYEAMMPLFNQAAAQRLDELAETIATIYARNFSVDELHDITAFFRSPTGQKYLAYLPSSTQENMAAGRQFGQEVADDVERLSGLSHQ